MTVAAAPEWRILAAKSSRSSHGGLHQLFSSFHSESGRWRESTASAEPSRHLALYRGSCLLVLEANRSTVWGPQSLLKCLNFRGASCQSELSVTRERLSNQTFASLRM